MPAYLFANVEIKDSEKIKKYGCIPNCRIDKFAINTDMKHVCKKQKSFPIGITRSKHLCPECSGQIC